MSYDSSKNGLRVPQRTMPSKNNGYGDDTQERLRQVQG
jgi:hypothetical protein